RFRHRARGGLCLTARRFRRAQRRGLCNRRHCSVSGRGRSVSGRGRGRRGWIGQESAAATISFEVPSRARIVPHQLKRISVRIVRYDKRRDVLDWVIARGLSNADLGGYGIDIREVNSITDLKALNLRLKMGRIV